MRNCAAPKVAPATRIAGQISIMAVNPAKAQMSQKGTMRSKGNEDDGGGAGESEEIEAGDAVQCDERNAHGAEGNRRGVGEQRKPGGLERLEAEADENGGADGDRCAEARGSFKECAEREGDEEKLQAAVGGDAGETLLQRDEAAGLAR